MEELYRDRYGVDGQILFPSWARNVSSPDSIPRAYEDHGEPLVGAYAGNIFQGWLCAIDREPGGATGSPRRTTITFRFPFPTALETVGGESEEHPTPGLGQFRRIDFPLAS